MTELAWPFVGLCAVLAVAMVGLKVLDRLNLVRDLKTEVDLLKARLSAYPTADDLVFTAEAVEKLGQRLSAFVTHRELEKKLEPLLTREAGEKIVSTVNAMVMDVTQLKAVVSNMSDAEQVGGTLFREPA